MTDKHDTVRRLANPDPDEALTPEDEALLHILGEELLAQHREVLERADADLDGEENDDDEEA